MPRLIGAVGAEPLGFFALGFLSPAALAGAVARGLAPSARPEAFGFARGVLDMAAASTGLRQGSTRYGWE
jgi:hypothetical protein